MKDLTSNITSASVNVTEVEITKANKSYDKVPVDEVTQHKSFMSDCMGSAEVGVNTKDLDKDRTYMACAIAYDQKYKTSYAPCYPGAGCIY